jgi:fructose-1-phosphate kinase PfkB-like protein
MARALPGHPTIAKMNEREFGETFQVEVESRNHLLRLGKQVLEQYSGINLVLTLGKDGMLAITAQDAYQASSPQQVAVNAAGAGDAASAALAWRLSQGDGWEDALIWAVATSAASVLTEPTAEVRWEDVVRIHADVKVERVRDEG